METFDPRRVKALEEIRRSARREVFSDDPRIEARAQRLLDKTAVRLRPYWDERTSVSAYANVMWM